MLKNFVLLLCYIWQYRVKKEKKREMERKRERGRQTGTGPIQLYNPICVGQNFTKLLQFIYQ